MEVTTKFDILDRQIEKIGKALAVACNLKATCDLVAFSPLLADQVGTSFAAHAYNPVPVVLVESVLLRVVALWDSPKEPEAKQTNSFPAVCKLLSDLSVQAELVTRYEARERSVPIMNLGGLSSEVLDVIRANYIAATKERLRSEFQAIIDGIGVVRDGPAYSRLFNHRTKQLAHNVEMTRAEGRLGQAMPLPKIQELSDLLDQSLDLHTRVKSAVTGEFEDWSHWLAQCDRNARNLWMGCKLAPLA